VPLLAVVDLLTEVLHALQGFNSGEVIDRSEFSSGSGDSSWPADAKGGAIKPFPVATAGGTVNGSRRLDDRAKWSQFSKPFRDAGRVETVEPSEGPGFSCDLLA